MIVVELFQNQLLPVSYHSNYNSFVILCFDSALLAPSVLLQGWMY
jgi:hypothetical protein